ncbi:MULTISPECIES: helix-turn-helix transcriptional regulator [Enterobacter]|uniref:helix-turn-helix domain-containing protein n=1 Tax=Enterobacter TaxID=547 RepID=UPI002FD0BA42
MNFRQECGISIGLYIRSRKLEKAAHMLRHTQLSVSDIFTMLGYEEPSTFSRAFSNQYGLSPTKYREQAKKSHYMNGLSMLITEVTRD